MTTSFTRTREQLRSMVLRKLGVIGAATSVVSTDADIVYEAIDLRLKEMHRLGIVWREVTILPAQWAASANTVTASASAVADVLFPIELKVVDGSLDQAVDIIGIREYAAISNKAETGTPEKALWNGNASGEFVLWPVPIAATTLKLTYERLATDTTAGSAIDVDVSMLRWVKDIIAYDVGDDFGIDEMRMQRFMREATQAEKNIRKLTVEHKDYSTVAVDDWTAGRTEHRETDYGR